MAVLGDLASDAKRDSDLVRAACVLDKQERAQGVMELATGELLVIRDANAGADARGFATEKLVAASQRLEGLVEQARECVGDKTPEQSDDVTRNEVDESPTIPIPAGAAIRRHPALAAHGLAEPIRRTALTSSEAPISDLSCSAASSPGRTRAWR